METKVDVLAAAWEAEASRLLDRANEAFDNGRDDVFDRLGGQATAYSLCAEQLRAALSRSAPVEAK